VTAALRLALAAACLAFLAAGAGTRAADAGPSSVLSRLVGASIVGAFAGPSPPPSFLARIRRGELGGVILFGDNVRSDDQLARTIAALRRAAGRGGNPYLLILVDQEGGAVRRLRSAPPSASARTMGSWSPARVRGEGLLTGRALHARGIDVDLAPVADVPVSTASFLGSRAFSLDRSIVASRAAAFATGLEAGGVAATAKHFPGLGAARANTDTADVVISAARARLLADLAPFERAIDAGVKLVMVSNAAYPALDRSRTPALFSRTIVTGLLRDRLGFDGVVVSDSMDAPAAQRQPPDRAIEAGVDLLLYTSARSSAAGFRRLLSVARHDRVLTARLGEAHGRVAALTRRLSANRREVRG
jgi:beta-N-acetylhexosaminidase